MVKEHHLRRRKERRHVSLETAAHLDLYPAVMRSGRPPGTSLETRRARHRCLTGFKRSINKRSVILCAQKLHLHIHSTICASKCNTIVSVLTRD